MNRYGFLALAEVKVRPGGRAQSARPPVRPRVGFLRAAVLLFAFGTAQGCYVYTPVHTARPAGTTLAFDVNDRGRVELGDLVGPSAARIEGVLRNETDTSYVVNVSSVTYLNGQTNQWAGEALTINKSQFSGMRAREFSRARTAFAAGGIAAGILAFILSSDLLGSGAIIDRPDPGPPDPT